ncbi:MAG: cell wall-binding repeat-containing protein [Desulfosporosinus sp.]|nr:cell wall-binding repeat-containing protein [Desulfosporosinus sp.]
MLRPINFAKRYREQPFSHRVSYLMLVLFFLNFVCFPFFPTSALADTASTPLRLAGPTRYATAIQISQATWSSANSVVLTRGDDFPDALAGAVLAKSSKVNGPLLITDSQQLLPEVLAEIQRLHAQQVYILGGTGAISAAVESSLTQNNLTVHRISGQDRYETAANIALEAVANSSQAFLASGNSFADALSVSSYAAAHGIPLLLTDLDAIPSGTLQTLQKLGVHSITIIGGEGVISPSVQSQLASLGFAVDRLAGADRYLTNIAVLNKLNYSTNTVYAATGEDFPDALSGAILAAKGNNPIMLVPPADINSGTLAYLNARRAEGSVFTLFGGWGVINYGIEDIIRTGSVHPRISLQYMQAYGASALSAYLSQLALLPAKATDSVDYLSPNLFSLDNLTTGQTVASGSITGTWSLGDNSYSQLVNAAHAKGLKLLPLIGSDWSTEAKATLDLTLTQDASRSALVKQLVDMVQTTGVDGVVIDFECMSAATGPYLTKFTQALYAELHAQNKLVIEAVPSRTASADWYTQYNYHDLAQYVDYLNIMTYDYSTSAPGAIAPLSWVEKVLNYTQGQGLDMSKVLLGIPYYGRDWTKTGDTTYSSQSVGLANATSTAASNHAVIQRAASGDTAGIPYYTYTDNTLAQHTVYYDDLTSWDAKLGLLDTYGLGGIGSWSLYWVSNDTAPSLFSLLKEHLRLP